MSFWFVASHTPELILVVCKQLSRDFPFHNSAHFYAVSNHWCGVLFLESSFVLAALKETPFICCLFESWAFWVLLFHSQLSWMKKSSKDSQLVSCKHHYFVMTGFVVHPPSCSSEVMRHGQIYSLYMETRQNKKYCRLPLDTSGNQRGFHSSWLRSWITNLSQQQIHANENWSNSRISDSCAWTCWLDRRILFDTACEIFKGPYMSSEAGKVAI